MTDRHRLTDVLRMSVFFLLAVAATACGGGGSGGPADAATGGDAGADAAPGDVAPGDAAGADAAVPDTLADVPPLADAEPPVDVPGGPDVAGEDVDTWAGRPDGWDGDVSLGGTPLEPIGVTWDQPLVLCNAWTEVSDPAVELRAKVRIVIPPQTRSGVEPAELEALALEGLQVHRGPFAAEQVEDVAAQTSTLTAYLIGEGGGGALWMAGTVEHRLGPVGTIWEQYQVGRAPGNEAPVAVGGDAYEVVFSWLPPGGDPSHAARLEPCGGPPELEDAVSLLVARGAARDLRVLRFWRTQETFAGSYPVHFRLHRVTFSDQDGPTPEVRDYWAQTYVAAHHNWEEATVLDFTRDLANWATVFEPLQRGVLPFWPSVQRVALEDANSFDQPATLTVVEVGTDGEERAPEVFTAENGFWQRVDTAFLTRSLQATCDGGAVLTLGWDPRYAYQVLTCPRAAVPGFRVVGLLPVAFRHDYDVVGRSFGEAAVTEATVGGHPGFRIAVAGPAAGAPESELEIEVLRPGGYILRTRDGDGLMVDEIYTEGDTLLGYVPDDAALVGESEDGAVTMELVRRWVGLGEGASSTFAPTSFALTFGGETHRVEAWDRMAYENTHHNWNDRLDATTRDGWRLHWKVVALIDEGVELVHTVWAEDPSGAPALPETEVLSEQVGGR